MLRLKIISFLLGTVLIIGCGSPNDPESIEGGDGGYTIVGRFTTPAYAQDVVIDGNLAYMAQGEGGLAIADISNPRLPDTVSVTFDGVRGYSSKIALRDSIVYLSAGSFGVTVVDVSNSLIPIVTISNLNMKPAEDFCFRGNYLITSVGEKGFQVAELSYPPQPDIRGGAHTPGYAHGMEVSADTNSIVIACGEMGLAVMDISNFQDGFGNYPLIGWLHLPGYAEDIALIENDKYACVACGAGGLQIVDMSDSANFKIIGSYSAGGYAKEIQARNGKLFLTAGQRGLKIFSIADKTAPKLIGTVKTKNARGFDMDDNFIYIADEEEGLIVVAIPN